MLLGGGYYGQRLNKIYRGKLKRTLINAHLSYFISRICDRTGNSRYPETNDQEIRTRET